MKTNIDLIPKIVHIHEEEGNIPLFEKLAEVNLHYENPLVVADEFTQQFISVIDIDLFKRHTTEIISSNDIVFLGHLLQKYIVRDEDVIISIGGGTVSDACKYLAHKLHKPLISIPTAISNDGIASPISVLKGDKDAKVSMGTMIPTGIFISLDLISKSPTKLILSGIGDLISNITSVWDWRLAYKVKKQAYNEFSASIALNAAYSTFYYLVGATQTDFQNIRDPYFLNLLTRGLILSGLAMSITGSSRPCSGSEHEISHAMDQYYGGFSTHGIQVALGTAFASYLQNNNFENIIRFQKAVGLPIQLSDMNLTKEKFLDILDLAPGTRADRYTILEHLNLTRDQYSVKLDEWSEKVERIIGE